MSCTQQLSSAAEARSGRHELRPCSEAKNVKGGTAVKEQPGATDPKLSCRFCRGFTEPSLAGSSSLQDVLQRNYLNSLKLRYGLPNGEHRPTCRERGQAGKGLILGECMGLSNLSLQHPKFGALSRTSEFSQTRGTGITSNRNGCGRRSGNKWSATRRQ